MVCVATPTVRMAPWESQCRAQRRPGCTVVPFLLRRIECALLFEGMSAQQAEHFARAQHRWPLGCVLAIVATMGCAFVALLRPSRLGQAPISA